MRFGRGNADRAKNTTAFLSMKIVRYGGASATDKPWTRQEKS